MSEHPEWFATSSCKWCGCMRKEHIDDGPCSRITDLSSINLLFGCNCQSFAHVIPTVEEARARR